VTTFQTGFNGIFSLHSDSGDLYVTSYLDNTVIRITNGVKTIIAGVTGSPGSTNGPLGTGLLFNPSSALYYDGDVIICDYANGLIRYLSSGTLTTIAGTPLTNGYNGDGIASAVLLNNPYDMCNDSVGNLYFTDQSNNLIRKLYLDSVWKIVTIAGGLTSNTPGFVNGIGTAAAFDTPRGITIDTSGNLYVADYENSAIRKIVISTGVVTTLVTIPPTLFPYGIVYDVTTNSLYITANKEI
jgi:hypothetical protein